MISPRLRKKSSLFTSDDLNFQEKQRGRSFTLDSQTYHQDNGLPLRYRKVKDENNNNEYYHQKTKSRQLTEGRRAKSLKDRKMSPPRIILSNEHKNLKYDDVILQYGNSPDLAITARNLRQMSITSSEDSNPDILSSSLNSESCLRPHERFYQGLRHSSCSDLTTLIPAEEHQHDLHTPNMGGHSMGRLMLIQQDRHMTSSHRNLNELNVRNTEQRKKSCSHIQNLELKKRVIEARVKARKRGETLKQLDDDFLKARDFMKRYKSQDTLFDHNNNASHEISRKETLKSDSTKSKKDDKRHSWIT